MAITSSSRPRPGPDTRRSGGRRRIPAAVVAAAACLAGCQGIDGSLSARNAFFASPSSIAGQVGLATTATIEAHQDLAVTQRLCASAPEAETADPQEAWIVCDRRAAGFHGRRAEAYRRWVEDQVRELPAPTDTAAAAGG